MSKEPLVNWSELNRQAAINNSEQFRIARDLCVYCGISPDYINTHKLEITIAKDDYSTITFTIHCMKRTQ